MKIHGMLLDSAKYPLLNLKSLFLLGFMILISSFLVSQYFDFEKFFGVKLSITSSLIVILLTFLILTIATILESGYTFKIIEKSLTESEMPPPPNK